MKHETQFSDVASRPNFSVSGESSVHWAEWAGISLPSACNVSKSSPAVNEIFSRRLSSVIIQELPLKVPFSTEAEIESGLCNSMDFTLVWYPEMTGDDAKVTLACLI